MDTKGKILLGFLLVVVIAVVGVGAFFLGRYSQLREIYDREHPNETTEKVEEPKTKDVEKGESKEDMKEQEKKTTEKKASKSGIGPLAVKGTDLVDAKGNKVQLKGVSSHGLQWYPDYINEDALKTFRDDWGANVLRLAMYTNEGGYCSGANREDLEQTIDNGVNYCNDLGMYCIIDWHILSDCHPVQYQEEAKDFFSRMSAKYAGYDNVIYEICNEPNSGANWDEIKAYADVIIPAIRTNDPDAVILVGTPNWSQDVDVVADKPVDDPTNVMYVCHFYAATHKDDLRNKVKKAIGAGTPVFISEFSICDASGNGALDYDSAAKWMELIDEYNLSYVGWNISNKPESSAFFVPSCNKLTGWEESDMTESGQWLRRQLRGEQ